MAERVLCSQPLRVLVVDDCADTANSLAYLVQCWGHDASPAYSGPQALEMARTSPPDVVLLDLGMPGMDGLEVARRLHASDGEPHPLMIVLSGFGRQEDRVRSWHAGCHLHLIKPVDLELLQQILQQRQRGDENDT